MKRAIGKTVKNWKYFEKWVRWSPSIGWAKFNDLFRGFWSPSFGSSSLLKYISFSFSICNHRTRQRINNDDCEWMKNCSFYDNYLESSMESLVFVLKDSGIKSIMMDCWVKYFSFTKTQLSWILLKISLELSFYFLLQFFFIKLTIYVLD